MEDFTKEVFSVWMNKFIHDLDTNKEKVLAAVDAFPGDREAARLGIEKGPDGLKKDVKTASNMMNFISYYATGEIKPIRVREKDAGII